LLAQPKRGEEHDSASIKPAAIDQRQKMLGSFRLAYDDSEASEETKGACG
jgi:hypothetical protein